MEERDIGAEIQIDALPQAKMASRMQEAGVTKSELTTETMLAVSQMLVVYDDPVFLEIFRRVPAKNGCQVTPAVNDEQALQAMRTGWPDLLLLDVRMATPLHGVEVVRSMVNDPALAAIPNIMIPSIDSSQHAANLADRVQLPINAWIRRPTGPDHLLKTVRRSYA